VEGLCIVAENVAKRFTEKQDKLRPGNAMTLARILIAIIIGGLALIGYLLYLLAGSNRRDPK
jgi:hypothetical protein